MAVTALEKSPTNERVGFLSRLEPFKGLDQDELERVAGAISVQIAGAGEMVQVESGIPGDYLFVVREGILELIHKGTVVAILSKGEVFGHPSLLTGLPPEFTTRARQTCTLWRIPRAVAVGFLSRPQGVRFVAGTLREQLIQAARSMTRVADLPARPVASLVRGAPVFCDSGTTIREAAQLMGASGATALLVRTSGSLGIVTDRDLREKVVAGDVPRDGAVTTVMTTPVKSVAADQLVPEAAIQMMAAGLDHLAVKDKAGRIVGVLSAVDLIPVDALNPFVLRRRIQEARNEDDLVTASMHLPAIFADLLDARVDAPALTRILTVLCDAMALRLLELFFDRRGQPPVAYAWLVFGSGARNELTLASDQDNGIAYDDSDDPRVEDYFRELAEDVNDGLARCGFAADPHGTVAQNWQWRLPMSLWRSVFARSLEDKDVNRLARASVAFDFRQLAGDLAVAEPLTEIMREAPNHRRFMGGLAALATRNPLPLLGLRHRVAGLVDVKRDCLRPIQNLARYHALLAGVSARSTLDRLVAVGESGALDSETEQSLSDAFTSMLHLQLRHHADALRDHRAFDNEIDVDSLRPFTRITLQEALRVVAATQRRFSRVPVLR